MKIVKFFFLLFLLSNNVLLFSQSSPVKIDLISHNNKLDASFFVTNHGNSAPAIILLHGFPGNQSSPLGLAEKLNNAGFNILVFNYQGSFSSEGNFSFENCIDNVLASLNFLKNSENSAKYNIDTARIFICGYSFGGAIALESAIYSKVIRNIISIANDDHSVSIKKAAADSGYRKGYGQFVAKSFGPEGPFRGDIKSVMDHNIANVDNFDLVKNAETLQDRKILFVVGWQDKTSLMEINTLPLYRKLVQLNAMNVTIKGFESDHRFNNVIDDVVNTIIDWINKQNSI
jgi:uncharacterized protein